MKRIENGLIEGLEYQYDEVSGRINWFKMIPEEYLYLNQDKKASLEKRLGKPFSEISISEVRDTDLVITLQGIRWLLDVRGYEDLNIKLDVANENYAAATCHIRFLPNKEEVVSQTYTSCACAHFGNTKSFYKNYLVEAASNRAMCRAVRGFLKINVVSKEELSDNPLETQEDNKKVSFDPKNILSDIMKSKNLSLAQLNTEFNTSEAKWSSVNDIPKLVVFKIIGKFKQ